MVLISFSHSKDMQICPTTRRGSGYEAVFLSKITSGVLWHFDMTNSHYDIRGRHYDTRSRHYDIKSRHYAVTCTPDDHLHTPRSLAHPTITCTPNDHLHTPRSLAHPTITCTPNDHLHSRRSPNILPVMHCEANAK